MQKPNATVAAICWLPNATVAVWNQLMQIIVPESVKGQELCNRVSMSNARNATVAAIHWLSNATAALWNQARLSRIDCIVASLHTICKQMLRCTSMQIRLVSPIPMSFTQDI